MVNLIPEQRVDKNGRTVTRHVKPETTAASAHKLPAPAMKKAERQKAFKPTAKQQEKRALGIFLHYTDCDAELTDKLAEEGYHYGKTVEALFQFNTSDTEFYDVHSVLSLGNTVTMMRSGVRSQKEALAILDSLHLGRLVEDNTQVTEAMLRGRVSFDSFVAFDKECPFYEGTDPQLYADAADMYSIKGYSGFTTPWGTRVPDEVLSGRISASDVKTIGVSRLQVALTPDPIFKALAAIKEGKTEYDAPRLAKFLDWTSGEIGYTVAIDMADTYGIDYVSGLSSLWKAQNIHDKTSGDAEERRAAITYGDRIDRLTDPNKPYSMTTDDILKLYREEIAPEVAVEQAEAGLTAEQIIAVHKEGIASSIASGFL